MGERLLYSEHDKGIDLGRLPFKGHAGLWYDKFCNQWVRSQSANDHEVALKKSDWISTLPNSLPQDVHILEEAVQRRQLMFKALGGEALKLKTDSSFVTGLGREHPVENGFAWHHSLGVPYLSGSSLKGMVRSWTEEWQDPKPDSDCINRIFGAKEAQVGDEAETSIGSVIFFDALPLAQVKLHPDVMTPHYSDYYQDEKKKTMPGDWLSPVPIPFLTVDKNASFQFGLAPRPKRCFQACEDYRAVREWLLSALKWIGAGAKTAVGYGRFVES